MIEDGLTELANPSAALLAERSDDESGSAVNDLSRRCTAKFW